VIGQHSLWIVLVQSGTYSALHLATPHVVKLVVRHLGRSLRQLAYNLDDIANGLLGGSQDFRDCAS
jgi:hypothetical protein